MAELQGVNGDLGLFSIFDVTQSLMMGRKTALVVVDNGGKQGFIYFEEGKITYAADDEMRTGDAAAFEVLAWRKGHFKIQFDAERREPNITRDTENLMLEVARVVDEEKRDQGIEEASDEVEETVAKESLEKRFRNELNKVFKQVATDRGAARDRYSVHAFDELLIALMDLGGTALYLRSATKPRIKTKHGFQTIRQELLAPGEIESFINGVLNANEKREFEESREISVNYTSKRGDRFKVSGFDDGGRVACIMTPASKLIPRLDELSPEAPPLARLLEERMGLVLIYGPLASGKSTLLASLVEDALVERDKVATLFSRTWTFDFADEAGFLIHSDLTRFSLGVGGSLQRALEQGSDLIAVDKIQTESMFRDALAVASRTALVIGLIEADGPEELEQTIRGFAEGQVAGKFARQFAATLKGIVNVDLNHECSGAQAGQGKVKLWTPNSDERLRLLSGDFSALGGPVAV
ncbi:MAG: DUF4388 domain-containing protein [Planctomycetota bacterium]